MFSLSYVLSYNDFSDIDNWLMHIYKVAGCSSETSTVTLILKFSCFKQVLCTIYYAV